MTDPYGLVNPNSSLTGAAAVVDPEVGLGMRDQVNLQSRQQMFAQIMRDKAIAERAAKQYGQDILGEIGKINYPGGFTENARSEMQQMGEGIKGLYMQQYKALEKGEDVRNPLHPITRAITAEKAKYDTELERFKAHNSLYTADLMAFDATKHDPVSVERLNELRSAKTGAEREKIIEKYNGQFLVPKEKLYNPFDIFKETGLKADTEAITVPTGDGTFSRKTTEIPKSAYSDYVKTEEGKRWVEKGKGGLWNTEEEAINWAYKNQGGKSSEKTTTKAVSQAEKDAAKPLREVYGDPTELDIATTNYDKSGKATAERTVHTVKGYQSPSPGVVPGASLRKMDTGEVLSVEDQATVSSYPLSAGRQIVDLVFTTGKRVPLRKDQPNVKQTITTADGKKYTGTVKQIEDALIRDGKATKEVLFVGYSGSGDNQEELYGFSKQLFTNSKGQKEGFDKMTILQEEIDKDAQKSKIDATGINNPPKAAPKPTVNVNQAINQITGGVQQAKEAGTEQANILGMFKKSPVVKQQAPKQVAPTPTPKAAQPQRPSKDAMYIPESKNPFFPTLEERKAQEKVAPIPSPKPVAKPIEPVKQPVINDEDTVKTIKDTIGSKESGNDYKAVNQLTGNALGKYQFVWSHHKSNIQKVTGKATREEFLNSPEAQEKYMSWYTKGYLLPAVEQYKELGEQIGLDSTQLAQIAHFVGIGGMKKYLENPDLMYEKVDENNPSIAEYLDLAPLE